MTEPQRPIPRATYRLQLHKDFTFADAAGLAPYLGELGISHAYLSPILKARPGSTHGYDTVDHRVLNPELGTLDDFRRMAASFRSAGVGLVLDIVPNHMGIGGAENPFWLDVLERGEASPYASWFDIDWNSSVPGLAGKVLVPFLDRSYAEALAGGQLQLRFDPAEGAFAVWASDHHKLPLSPESYAVVLASLDPALLERVGLLGGDVSKETKPALRDAYHDNPAFARSLESRLAAINANADELGQLVDRQHWRAARHDVADDEINYRRFFIVSDLAAIRAELPEVFDATHAVILGLIAEGLVDGLRIDHIDGLYDPAEYCRRLRREAARPITIVVEKILAENERLPADWDVEGTTGYEFAALALPLLVDPQGEATLTEAHQRLTGITQTPVEMERETKVRMMDNELAAEFNSLADRLAALAAAIGPRLDLTRGALARALRAFAADLPVYRVYRDGNGISAADRDVVLATLATARSHEPRIEPAAFDFLRSVLVGEPPPVGTAASLDLAMRIQQFTGPVMAKGLEDTALYRYNRLIALNDVGERPDRFSLTVEEFHEANRQRARSFPYSMLGTSSHDSKRGEDTRARLAVLSGRADEWTKALANWIEQSRHQGFAELHPDDVNVALQLIVGAWPAELPDRPTGDELAPFADRVVGAMMKALREARLRSDWVHGDEAYETRVEAFIRHVLTPGAGPLFEEVAAFSREIGLEGAINGLLETTLKLTVPGVPDIYQGADLWEQSLVDPDNRRPVDFGRRRRLLAETSRAESLDPLLDHWQDGAVKQQLIARLLELRQRHPGLFRDGSYEPIDVPGDGRICAFRRRLGDDELLVALRLYPWRDRQAGWPPLELAVPDDRSRPWVDVLTSTPVSGGTARTHGRLPVLVLTNAATGPD